MRSGAFISALEEPRIPACYPKNESSTMFDDCTQLVGENGTVYDESRRGTDYARIDDGQSNPGYFTFCARVAYDAGEGVTGDVPAEISVFPGTEITLPSSFSFSKSGYKFAGWSDGKSVYVAGDKYTVGTSNVTFEAQWECLHEHSEIKNAKEATTSAAGYTGDTYCTVCGEKVKSGEAIPSLAPETTPTTNPTPSGESVGWWNG